MISRWVPLTLFVVVFAPDFLHAQTREIQFGTPLQGVAIFEMRSTTGDAASNNDKMYEDIEIFRRILGHKLQPLYPRVSYPNVISNPFTNTITHGETLLPYSQATIDFNHWSNPKPAYTYLREPNTYILASPPNKEEVLSSLEGVYLIGQGVVYTATVSSLQPPAKAEADRAVREWMVVTTRVDSEWESIRKQVRNEKEKPKKAEESKPPSLSDVMLKVLAENGHHFSQLGENESLTIVLTVHDTSDASLPAKSGGGSAKTEPKPATSGSGSYLSGKANDLELLGELHLKQGKYKEAIIALHEAYETTKSPKRKAEVCRKLAQCYLMRQDPADFRNARATLEEAIALMEKETEAKEKPAPAAKPAPALPVKVIISTRKKQLDQVKAGEITFEEFRRQAGVVTLRFGDRK